MNAIPPIKAGPRLTREEAVNILVRMDFTRLEAVLFLDAEDRSARQGIYAHVMKRLKEE